MIEQGTDEWKLLRVGKATASRIPDVIAKTKTGWGASRGNYLAELVCERVTGQPYPQYVSVPMQFGIDTQPKAQIDYEMMFDVTVNSVGFVPHPTIVMSGASPDGLVGVIGLIEIKCPNTATHINTLLGTPIAGEYITQMQWQMACTGRGWCDWISYDPRLPPAMQLYVQRVPRDDERIEELEELIVQFLAELDEKERELRSRYATDKAA